MTPKPYKLGSKPDKILVAYHDNCLDGFTAAWVATRGLQAMGYEITLMPMNYTSQSTDELTYKLQGGTYSGLCIVDFSLQVATLARIESTYPDLDVSILDHHKTAFEKYAPNVEVTPKAAWQGVVNSAYILLDNNESGASLVWKNFHEKKTLPKLVAFVKDYDLYRFSLGNQTKWVNKYLKLQTPSLRRWDELSEMFENPDTLALILDAGEELQVEHDKEVTKIAKDAAKVELQGLRGLFVFCPYGYASDVGHTLATKCGTYGACLSVSREAGDVRWSLRSNGGYDVSSLAKLFGGGGHKNAAGFTTSIEQAEALTGWRME